MFSGKVDSIDPLKSISLLLPSCGVFKSLSLQFSESDSAAEPSRSSDQPALRTGADVEDELVAYCCKKYNGDIGYTYTKNAYRKQGFGSAVTLAIINEAVKHEQPAFVFVIPENDSSIKMHENLGFHKLPDHQFSILFYERIKS